MMSDLLERNLMYKEMMIIKALNTKLIHMKTRQIEDKFLQGTKKKRRNPIKGPINPYQRKNGGNPGSSVTKIVNTAHPNHINTISPFLIESNFDDATFKAFYKITKSQFVGLFSILDEILAPLNISSSKFNHKHKFLLTLRFLFTDHSIEYLKKELGYNKVSIRDHSFDVCTRIFEHLSPTFMKFPSTVEEWKAISKDFKSIHNFPNCLGILDARYIIFKNLWDEDSVYCNVNNTDAMLLLSLVDARGKFIAVDIGFNDEEESICNNVNFFKLINHNECNIPKESHCDGVLKVVSLPYVFLSEKCLPLPNHLMQHSPKSLLPGERILNRKIESVIKTSENAYHLLNARFPFYNNKLIIKPETSVAMVKASIMLHNLLLDSSPQEEIDAMLCQTIDNKKNLIPFALGSNFISLNRSLRQKFGSYFKAASKTVMVNLSVF